LDFNKTIEWLKLRLKEELPGRVAHEQMAPRLLPMPDEIPLNARPSAVLSLLFPIKNETHILLIKRTEDGHAHSGQISFPGGRQDPTDADLKATALREAQEEVGIMSTDVNVIGALTPLYIPVSNFQVYPYIAFSETKLDYNLSQSEVSYVIEAPLKELVHIGTKSTVTITSPLDTSLRRDVKAYKLVDGSVIWGATAMILSELETILQGM
jgi:8-oxo-dGTP pyrophosphatase MutT (NUDIX family)